MSNQLTALVVVAKAPRPGQVKTRLCPPLSPTQAAGLYQAFLLDTIQLAGTLPGVCLRVVCPSELDAQELAGILPAGIKYIVQRGKGLSGALLSAFQDCQAAGFGKTLCLSSDNPTLPTRYLQLAIEALNNQAVALGPADDGGYYVIGARQPYPVLFEDMVWSNPDVLAVTLQRAAAAGLSTSLLPTWYDLDTVADLARLLSVQTSQATVAPFTRQALQALEIAELRVA